MQIVAADRDRLPGLELGNTLAAKLRLANNAQQRDAESHMGQRRTPSRARQPTRARKRSAERNPQEGGTLEQIRHRADDHEDRKPERKRHQH